MNAQYTLARSFGNTGGSNEAQTSSNNAREIDDYDFDIGYNNFDVRHTFNLSAIYTIPYGRAKKTAPMRPAFARLSSGAGTWARS